MVKMLYRLIKTENIQAYGCPVGSKMNPKDKCSVW